MATIENIANAKVCVSTFANPSQWVWLKLSDFDNAEQFLNEARQILGAAKSAKLDFVDFSEIEERMANDLDKYFELEKEFNELDETEQQALTAWLDDDYCRYANNEASEIIEKFRNAYNGQWDSTEDFAYNLAEELYFHELPEIAQRYFDCSAFARDLFIGDYTMLGDGYVFSNY